MSAQIQALRQYYDANTARFLRFGGSGGSRAIHRGLWEDGVHNAEQAADRINQRIVETWNRLALAAPKRVRDLGCGVGGSLFHFAQAWPEAALEGLTLSPRQAAMAAQEAMARGLDSRLRIACTDFLQPAAQSADLVVAIESHVHAPSAATFLTAAARGLSRTGKLVIVDDMLARPESQLSVADQRLVATFRRGWRLGHVPDAEDLKATAAAAGLHCLVDEDLTQHLRLNRWRDLALHALAPLADALGGNRWPLFANMIGGNALTLAYKRGIMRYRLMMFAGRGRRSKRGRALSVML